MLKTIPSDPNFNNNDVRQIAKNYQKQACLEIKSRLANLAIIATVDENMLEAEKIADWGLLSD